MTNLVSFNATQRPGRVKDAWRHLPLAFGVAGALFSAAAVQAQTRATYSAGSPDPAATARGEKSRGRAEAMPDGGPSAD